MEGAVILALLCISLNGLVVDGQVITGTPGPLDGACGGGDDELEFREDTSILTDFPSAIQQCSGLPTVVEGAAFTPICGVIDENAARRACWASGVNLDNGRNYRLADCRPHQTVTIAGVDTVVEDQGGAAGSLDSEPKYSCNTAADECFEECYEGVYTGATGAMLAGALNPGDCGLALGVAGAPGTRALAAVACFDRDECKLGVLTNCDSECDEDCDCVDPCAANAVCSNDPFGWTCTCAPGYTGTPAEAFLGGTGCVDEDECSTLPNPCPVGQVCQNTIGSYVCSCNNWKLYQYPTPAGVVPPVDDQCSDVTCPAIVDTDIANSATTEPETNQSGRVTVTCDAGFVSSNDPSSADFDLTCRDGRWCTCAIPSCQPQECGDPGSDPNAMHPPVRGIEGDVANYTCTTGFEASNGDPSYTKTCQLGSWINTNGPCEATNLCVPNPCGGNAQCQRTSGSYVCFCDRGYTRVGSSCIVARCGNPPSIKGAEIHSSTGGYTFGAITVYKCVKGYTTCHPFPNDCPDKFTLRCESNELWTPTQVQPLPKCSRINCGDPGVVCNSDRSASRFNYEDTVTYTCKEGFRPTGGGDIEGQKFTIECEEDGEWERQGECEDINECANDPCDGDKDYSKNICINTPGSFRCVCSYGYNLGKDGKSCTADSGYLRSDGYNAEPCDWYSTMSLCRYGRCKKGHDGLPYCECNEGYTGPYCTEKGQNSTEIIAIVGLSIACVALLCCCIVCFCFCCVNNPIPGHGHVGPPTHGHGFAGAQPYGGFHPRKFFGQLGW